MMQKTSVITSGLYWLYDMRNIFIVAITVVAIFYYYDFFQNKSRVEVISNAANVYAPLISECLQQKSTLECLAQLKVVADTETFEAVKKVTLTQ